MTGIFLHDFSCEEDVFSQFETKDEGREGVRILFATYTYENYSGSAFVLLEKDGKLFEVNGSHCSCYGLEGQWALEEADKDALLHRLRKGDMGGEYEGNWSQALIDLLDPPSPPTVANLIVARRRAIDL